LAPQKKIDLNDNTFDSGTGTGIGGNGKPETAYGNPSQFANSKPETAYGNPSQFANSKPETAHGNPSQFANSKPETAHGNPSQFANSKPETAQGNPSRDVNRKLERAQGNPSQFANSKLETVHSNPSQNTAQVNSLQDVNRKPGTAQSNRKPGTIQDNSLQEDIDNDNAKFSTDNNKVIIPSEEKAEETFNRLSKPKKSRFDPGLDGAKEGSRNDYNWYSDLREYSKDKEADQSRIGSRKRIGSVDIDSHRNRTRTLDDEDTDLNRTGERRSRGSIVDDVVNRLATDSKCDCGDEGHHRGRGQSRGNTNDSRSKSHTLRPHQNLQEWLQPQDPGYDPNNPTRKTDKSATFQATAQTGFGIDQTGFNEEEEKADGRSGNKRFLHDNLIDETRDTGFHKNHKSGDFTGLFGNTLYKDNNKDFKLNDLMKNKLQDKFNEKTYQLSRKVTGESDLNFDEEEESPFFVKFKKRRFDEEESVLLSHPEELVESLEIEHEHVKSPRSEWSESKIELEEIDEPISNTMIHLFVGMKKKITRMEYLVQEVRKPEYTLDTFFDRNFKFFKGKLAIKKNFFFIFLLLTAVMLFFVFDTLKAKNLSRVRNDDEKLLIAKLLAPAAIIFTYYGMAILYIPMKWLKIIVSIILLVCAIILGIDLGKTFIDDDEFPYARVYICAFILATNVFWVATRLIRKDILQTFSWAWSMLFMATWCILLPTATVGFAIYVSVISRRFNYTWAHDLTLQLGIPTMLLLCLTWVYYHFKFFVPAARKKLARASSTGENALPPPTETQQKTADERMREQFAEVSDDGEEEKDEEPPKPLKVRIYLTVKYLIKKVSYLAIVASSFSLGGSLIFIEGLLLVYVATITNTKGDEVPSDAAFYLAIVLYFFIPAAVLFGIPIIATSKNHEKKMFWIPVVAILFPLFVTMPIASHLLNQSSDTNPIGLFFALAPSVVIAFWITVSYIGLRRKKTKFSLISYIFICFVIPLVVLQPLIDTDAFKAVAVAQGFAILFIVIGIIILVIVIAYLISRAMLIKEITKKDRLNTDNYKLINVFRTNLEPFGFWANAFGFIVNFTISLYTVFRAPDNAPNDLQGLALGLSLCFILFFIYNNLGMHLNTIDNPEISKYGIKSLSAAIIQSVRSNELYGEIQKIIDWNNRVIGWTRIATIFIAIVSSIVALGVSADSDFALNTFAALAVGSVVIQLVFELYSGIKEKYSGIARATIPMIVTYLWFVHALAFPSVLHYTRVFYGDEEAKRKRIQTQLIALVFVITVSLIAIIANIIFKGIELEQKIKYILSYLRKQLENIAVKSDYFVLHKIFDNWMEHGENKLRKMLVNRGKPAFWWPVPATNPNTKYSKVLLDFDAYQYMKLRLKNRLENQDGEGIDTTKKIKPGKSWLKKCLSCLGCCFPFLSRDKRLNGLDEEMNEEIEELLDLQMHEIPLPPKEGDEESDESSDDDFDPGDFGDWEVESKIAENLLEINDIKFKPLDERVLRAMMYYDSGIKFAHSDKWTVDFLKFVYRLFAVGNYKYFKRRWLDYVGYKRFMILSALTLAPEFPDYMIDLVYTLYTHNVGRGQIQRRVDYSTKKNQARKKKLKKNKKEIERDNKMRVKVFPIFEEDFEGFLIHLAKRRFPNEINDRDALFRLIRWHLFPNFLHLLPSVQKEYPHEYDYLLFLIDMYMKMDRDAKAKADAEANANAEGADANKDGQDGENGKDKNTNQDGENNGLLGSADANNKDGNGNSRLNDSNDSLNRKKKRSCLERAASCLCKTLSAIGGAVVKCGKYLFGKLVDFFLNFFFLKTDAQRKADKEFEETQRKADQEEKEEVRKIRADKAAQFQLGDDPDVLNEDLNKEGQFRRKRRTYPHKPSPEWPAIVETIIKSLKDAENDYERKKASAKQPYFIPNARNFCTLLAKIFEVYCLACIAFRVEVPWGWSFQEVLSFPSGFTTAWKMKIWSSLAYSIFYCYIGLTSIGFAKEGVLGADKATMKAGEFPSRGFAHSQILTHFSTTLSVWIITTFIDLFACDYYATPNVLFYMPEIQCGSYLHHWFIVLAACGLFLYYPISSFLYPNLQYLNVGNDFKYDPSFVVLFNQAKLIIIAVTIFFPYENEAHIPLLVSIAIWLGLAVVNRILKPNVVKVLNIWETGLYFAGAWVNIAALIARFSKNTALSTTILILGLIAITIITYAVHRYKRLHRKSTTTYEEVPQSKKKVEEPVQNEEEFEPIHPMMRPNVLPDELQE